LWYFEGCTPTEKVAALGIPVPTVKTRARVAIRALMGLVRSGPVP